jgi:tetratricopeptide (TPR) repeat protein
LSRTQIRSRKLERDTHSTSSARILILICLIGFAIRVAVAMSIGRLPLSRTPQYDALEYLMWAQRIAAGDFTWPVNPPHGPTYPFFLGVLLLIGRGSLMFARIAQAALGAATCYFAGLTAKRIFSDRGSLITAGLLAIYAPLVWLDVSIASEGLLVFLLAAALFTRERSIVSGILMGLAILTRPTAILFLPLFANRKTILASLLTIVPVTIANWQTSHAFIPIQAFGGMNIYLGNSPLRDGKASARPGGDWDRIEPQAARQGAKTIPEEDRYFIRRTLAEIADRPLGFVKLLFRKLFWTFQNDELRDTHSFYFFVDQAPILRFLPGFLVLFAFAVGGALFADWKDPNVRMIALFNAIAVATCLLLVVGARYRIPLALGFALQAAPIYKNRRVVVAAFAAALTLIARDPSTHNFGEEWSLTASSLLKEGHIDEASAAAQKATQTDPSNALGWDTTGMIEASQNRDAEPAFRRALQLNPQYTAAHEHLGLLLAQKGDVNGASAEYRAAVALDPRRVKALMGLARLEGALGHAAEGLKYAQRAAELQPPDDDGWLLIAMLAADARRFDVVDLALAQVTDTARAEQVRETIRSRR